MASGGAGGTSNERLVARNGAVKEAETGRGCVCGVPNE